MQSQTWLPITLGLIVIAVIAVVIFLPTEPEYNSSPQTPLEDPELSQEDSDLLSSVSLDTNSTQSQSSSPTDETSLLTPEEQTDIIVADPESETNLIPNSDDSEILSSTSAVNFEEPGINLQDENLDTLPNVVGGIISDPKGMALPGVSVSIGADSPETTDASGGFLFHSVNGEEVSLQASKEGYYPLEQSVPVGNTQLQLVMIPEGSLAGQVIDQNNAPIAYAEVEIKSTQGIWIHKMKANSSGWFEIDSPPDSGLTITARLEGYTNEGEGTQTVQPPFDEAVVLRLHQPSFSISGRVVMAETQSPVANFRLTAQPQDQPNNTQPLYAQSDGTGMYMFKDLQRGTYLVSSSAAENNQRNVVIPINEDFKTVRVYENDARNVDFIATQGRTVSGLVETSNGQPVSNAMVTIAKYESATTYSDFTGHFILRGVPTLSTAPGAARVEYPIQLLATHEEYGSGMSDPLPPQDPNQPLPEITIVLEQTASLSGVVMDTQGNPIPSALVQLISLMQNNQQGTTSSGAGAFQFDQVYSVQNTPNPLGITHRIEVMTEGYAQQQQEISIQPGETKVITIVLEPGNVIQGYLSNSEGDPVGGVFSKAISSRGETYTTESDRSGVYRFESIPPGTYDLFFQSPSTPSLTAVLYDVPANQQNANAILLPNEWIVMGTVVDSASQQPLRYYMVTVEGRPIGGNPFTFTRTINTPDGTYQIKITEPGQYSLQFTSPEHHPAEGRVNIAQAAMREQFLNIQLEPLQQTGSITGTFAPPEGTELAGVNVMGIQTFPAQNNSFLLENIPFGKYDLLFYVRQADTGDVYPLGVLPNVDLFSEQPVNIGQVSENSLSIQYRPTN